MKRKLVLAISLLSISAILLPGFPPHAGAQAQSISDPLASVDIIVELEGAPVVLHELASGTRSRHDMEVQLDSIDARAYEMLLEAEQRDFKSRVSNLTPAVSINAELRRLANAISLHVPANKVAEIAAVPGVRSIEYVKEFHSTLDASVRLIRAPEVWEKLGGSSVAGEGMRIAILDTGIDITNPLFFDNGYTAPDGFPRTNNGSQSLANNKVIVAKSFLSDATATALDENGHGTNVAGIAAGNLNTRSPLGFISGVAPRAFLGNYRVLARNGSGRTDLIARALEEAVTDGFDIANMSLGGSAGKNLDFLSRSVETAVAAGMIVVVAAGNSGENGEMSVGSPGIAPSAITVAASTNAHIVGPVVKVVFPDPVAPEIASIGSLAGAGSTAVFQSAIGPASFADAASLGGGGLACGPLTAGSLTGKVALIERGDCTFTDKVNAADQAGALAAIIFNKDLSQGEDGGETFINMNVTGTRIPSVFIVRSAGLALRDLQREHPGAKINIDPFGGGSSRADVLASFSSRGPTATGIFKPDISAPGFAIYSGAIKENNPDGVSDPSGFLAVNGTSQATPHVAGAAALLKQLHPAWNPEQIKSALISSASPTVISSANSAAPAGLLDMGSGRADVAAAADVEATFSPATLSFGFNKKKKKPLALTADLKITGATGGQSDFTVEVQRFNPDPDVNVTPSVQSISITGGQSATISLLIEAGKKAERRDNTGFLILRSSSGQVLRVPFWIRYVKKL